jgi:hypothetical protein
VPPFDLSAYFGMLPQTQPRRELSLADLWQQQQALQYPEPPSMLSSYREIGGDANRDLRREAILRAAMALGGNPGDIGQNLVAGAADLSDWQRRRLAEENARREEQYGRDLQRFKVEQANRDLETQNQEGRRVAEGKLALVKAISSIEPAWAERAEALAMSGDDVALRQMAKDVERNRKLREMGHDPTDPFIEKRIEAQIQTEEEGKRVAAREAAESEAQKELDMYWRQHGKYQAPQQYEPLDRIAARTEMVEGIRLRYDQKRDALKGTGTTSDGAKIGKQGDLWGEIRPGVNGGPPEFIPAAGQRDLGNYTRFSIDGRIYQIDKTDPSGEAFEVKMNEGPPPPKQTMDQKVQKVAGLLGRPLTPEERKTAESEFLRGTHSSKIAARLRAPKPIEKPKNAPTLGPVPGQEKKAKGPQKPQTKPKLDDRYKAQLRARIKKDHPSLDESMVEMYVQEAVRRAEGGS